MGSKTRRYVRLAADAAWSDLTYQEYCARVALPALAPSVDGQVRERFDRVQRLLHHCYFQYEFLQFAHDYALMTLETSLRARFREIEPRHRRRPKGLKALLQWASSQHLLHHPKPQLKNFEALRNHSAHPLGATLFGYQSLSIISQTILLVNQLNQDPQLSKQRLAELRRIESFILQIGHQGGRLEVGDQRVEICIAAHLHYDYADVEPNHRILLWPRFEIDPDAESVEEGGPFVDDIQVVALEQGSLQYLVGKVSAKLMLNDDEASVREHEDWLQRVRRSRLPIAAVIGFRIGELERITHREAMSRKLQREVSKVGAPGVGRGRRRPA